MVSGASSGIGAAIARGLAQAGARVALLDCDAAACDAQASALRAAGADAIAVHCDIASAAAVDAAAQQVQATLGAASVLVNNAGLLRAGPLAEVDMADWNDVLAVNLNGYLLCVRAFGGAMRAARRGAARQHRARGLDLRPISPDRQRRMNAWSHTRPACTGRPGGVAASRPCMKSW